MLNHSKNIHYSQLLHNHIYLMKVLQDMSNYMFHCYKSKHYQLHNRMFQSMFVINKEEQCMYYSHMTIVDMMICIDMFHQNILNIYQHGSCKQYYMHLNSFLVAYNLDLLNQNNKMFDCIDTYDSLYNTLENNTDNFVCK